VHCANLCGVVYDTTPKGTLGWVKTLRRLNAHESKRCPLKRERPSEASSSSRSNLSAAWAQQIDALAPLAAAEMTDASVWGASKRTGIKRAGVKTRKVVTSATVEGNVSIHCCYSCGVVYETPSRGKSALEWTKTLRRLNAHESQRCPKRREGREKMLLEQQRKRREREVRCAAAAAAAAAAQPTYAVPSGASLPTGAVLYARAVASRSFFGPLSQSRKRKSPGGSGSSSSDVFPSRQPSPAALRLKLASPPPPPPPPPRDQASRDSSLRVVTSVSGSLRSRSYGTSSSPPPLAPEEIFDDIELDLEQAVAAESLTISVTAGDIHGTNSCAVLTKGEQVWRDRPNYRWTKVPQYLAHTDFVKMPHKEIPRGTSYTITSSKDAMIYLAVEPSVRDGGFRASLPNAGFTLVSGEAQLAWGGGFQKPGSGAGGQPALTFNGVMVVYKKSIKAGATVVLPKTTTMRTVACVAAELDFSQSCGEGRSESLAPSPLMGSPLPRPLSLPQPHSAAVALPLFDFNCSYQGPFGQG
tara:strand:+ start:146 stop:1726 length:1581 start_codon:yes stop_codon:yes gene_type:complete